MTRVKLADLPIKWLRGNGFRKTDLVQNGEYGCILYGELFTKHKSPLIQPSKLSRTNRIGNVSTIAGDILIPGTSTAKKSDMVLGREVDSDGVFLGGDINVLRPQQGLFASRFLPYFLESQDALEQLEPYIQGATGIIHLSNKGIKSLEVPLPPLSEQQRIVSILDKAFAAIDQAKANTERNLKNAKELFESYLQEVFKNKEAGWKLKTIGDVCSVIAGQSPEGKFYNANGIGIPFYQGKRDYGEKYLREPSTWTTKVTKEAQVNDILMSVRAPVGPINLATQKICIGRGLAAIRAEKQIDGEFLYYFLLKHESEIIGNIGAVFNSINKSQIKAIEIPLPPLEAQQTVVLQLDALRAETQTLEAVYQKKLSDLDELKKSFLQKAFTGELTTA